MKEQHSAGQPGYREGFVREYRRLRPGGAADYDRRRQAGLPSWQAAARALGVATWPELLERCGLSGPALTFSFDSPSIRRLRELERLIKG